MAVAGSLTYDTKIDSKGFEKGLKGLNTKAVAVGNIVADAFTKMTSTVTTAITEGIKYNATIEQLKTSFEVMTGSADKATEIVERLKDIGAKTPFEFTGLAETTQLLMNYGLSADDAIDKMMMLGDISQGSAEKMNRIAMAYGQMSSAGKVSLEDIKQMIEAGFNPLREISDTTGESMASLYDRISDGTISVDEITASMERSTSAGGKYFQSMDKQSQTLNGQLSTLKDNFSNFIGTALEPVNEILTQEILPHLNEFLSSASEGIQNIDFNKLIDELNRLLAVVESVGVAFLAWKIGGIVQSLVITFQKAQVALSLYTLTVGKAGIAQGIMNGALSATEVLIGLLTGKITLAQVATGLLSKAQAMLNAVMSANPIMLIITAIGILVGAILYLWNTNEDFRNAVGAIWDAIKSAFETAINFIVNIFNTVIDFIKKNWKGLLLLIANPFAGAFKLLYDNCEGFRNFIDDFVESIKEFFINGWNSIVEFFTETIPAFIQSVIEWFMNLPYNIGYAIGTIIGFFINLGINLWNWVTVELPKIIQSIITWFANLPSKIWEFLTKIVTDVAQWGQNVFNTAVDWVSQTINNVVNWFKGLPGKIWTWLQNAINKVKEFGTNIVNKAKTSASNLVTKFVDTIKGLPNKLKNLGQSIVEGLWNGIKNAGNWLWNKVREFAQGVIDAIKDQLGIHSPSRVMAYWGKYIPQGLAVGIEADTDSAVKAIENMNNEIEKKMKSAVYSETAKVNASASVKSNNIISNVGTFNIQLNGEVDIDGKRAGKILAPEITKTFRTGGVTA